MRYINVESDFKLLESFDCNCEVNLRDSEFEFEYYTKKHSDNRITVSYKDGKCSSNCKFTKDNRLIVLFENHNLEPGTLKVKRYFNLNDADFSDKTCDFVIEEELPISLTKGIQPCTEECCYVDVKLPPYYQKGDIGPVGPKGDKGDQGDKGDKGDLTVTGATPHNNLLDNTAFNQFDYEDNLSYWNIRGNAEIEIYGGENGIGNNALLIKSYEDSADNTVNPSTLCIKGIGYVLSLYTKAYNNEKRTLLINIPNLHRGLFYVDGQQGKLNNLGYISLEQSTNWEKHYITFTVSGESPIFFVAPSTANDGVLIAQVKLESNPINGLPDLANLMPTPWTLSANDLKGKDIYELLVESNKFEGTRKEFEDDYINSINNVKNATNQAIIEANNAQMIGQHVQQVERDILQREDERSDAFDLAQSNRQQAYEDAEDIRNSEYRKAEEDRKKAESDRQALFQSNEEFRQNTFNTNETTRQNNEIIRQTKEAERETKEAERQSIFSTNEAERQRIFETNEVIREENERRREEAETNREATFQTNEAAREAEFGKAIQAAKNNLVVVNDLTTGGADNALSAEMGKEIALVANKVVEKSITIVSQSMYEPLQLDFPIPRGSYISVEGDFKTITCRTNSFDTEYQTISGNGIADRDITYIKKSGVGTATMTIKGEIYQFSDAIAKNTDDLQTLKIEECYILESNFVSYPARRNGAQQNSGEDFKGYEIDLEEAYINGYRYIKVRTSTRIVQASDSAILPAIVLDKAGAVESLIETETDKVKTTAWYILPITENSQTLRATYADGKYYPDTKMIPYKYELLTELPPQVVDYSNDIKNLNTEITGLKKAVGLDIYIIPENYPARKDGSTTYSGSYKGYEVNIEDAFAKGFRFIKVRAASYFAAKSDNSVVPCLVYDKNGNVESVITEFETMTTNWYILPITENSSKVRCSYATTPFVSGSNVYNKIVFEPYKYELLTDNDASERLSIIEETLGNVSSLINGVEIFLPPDIYILKGRMTQLFFRGFIKAVDPYVYDIKVQCAVGKTYKRYYEIAHNTAGNFPFKIEVRDDNKRVLGVAETTIKIIEPSSASSKNILCCGASATETGHWAAELKRLLTTGSEKYSGLNLPMTFVGRKVGSSDKSVQLEATGGWTWSTFISAGVPAVRFYITGMTGNIGIGTKLTLNDAEKGTLQYSVLEVNLTEGVGNIRCGEAWPNPVVFPSSTSGTLTGDSISITFNNVVEERFTPFYNAETGEVDFKTYANNYCNGDIDILVTHMGVNSVLAENSPTPIDSIKAFLDGYFKDFPSGKVLVSAIPFPDYGTNIYTNTYKENNTNRYGSLCSFFDYNKNLYKISQLGEYKGKVIYCPSNVFFDTDYGYPKTNKDVNSRITSIKESIDTNGVHPIKEGSYLISDSILPTIITL